MRLKQYIYESLDPSLYKNKYGYGPFTFFAIYLWGALLYMTEHYLPNTKSYDESQAEEFAIETLKHIKSGNKLEIEKEMDWWSDGAPIDNGRILLTRQLFDKWISKAEKQISKPLIIKRYSKNMKQIDKNRWMSFTIGTESYSHQGPEHIYELQKGAKVIYADGIADKDEIIIRSDELLKYGKRIN